MEQRWGDFRSSVDSSGTYAHKIETVVPGDEVSPRLAFIIESQHGISHGTIDFPNAKDLVPIFVCLTADSEKVTQAEIIGISCPLIIHHFPLPVGFVLIP